jgi:hypothetical protein
MQGRIAAGAILPALLAMLIAMPSGLDLLSASLLVIPPAIGGGVAATLAQTLPTSDALLRFTLGAMAGFIAMLLSGYLVLLATKAWLGGEWDDNVYTTLVVASVASGLIGACLGTRKVTQ